MVEDRTEYPVDTPWGPPQEVAIIAPGIMLISTASHGGYWLSSVRNKQVPVRLRRKTFMQNGRLGWYEEDEDAAIVESVFSEYFANGRPPLQSVNGLKPLSEMLQVSPSDCSRKKFKAGPSKEVKE